MNELHIQKIAAELKVQPRQVLSTARLFAEGATVPFIARYRKEATGLLDEVAITTIRERLIGLAEFDQRRDAIVKSLEERNLLTDKLKADIASAENLTRLEDIYQPFRPKRRTRAMIAKEQGLEPLADLLFAQQAVTNPQEEAAKYVSTEKGVADVNAALAGARDIIAERVSDDARARAKLRDLYWAKGVVHSKAIAEKQEEGKADKLVPYGDRERDCAARDAYGRGAPWTPRGADGNGGCDGDRQDGTDQAEHEVPRVDQLGGERKCEQRCGDPRCKDQADAPGRWPCVARRQAWDVGCGPWVRRGTGRP